MNPVMLSDRKFRYELPCGDWVIAERNSRDGFWRIRLYDPDVEEVDVFGYPLAKATIHVQLGVKGTVRALRKLVQTLNQLTPDRYKDRYKKDALCR